MSYDDADSISYNPFASDVSHSRASSVTQGYYSSAFFPKLVDTSPSLRRRRSSITGQNHPRNDSLRRKQSRFQEDEDDPDSPTVHPLKSALLASNGGCLPDLGITRPSLSRLLGEGTSSNPPSEETLSHRKTPSDPDEEKDVIVHQISSKDSLAGIALKYGISLANLRRSNQLWTSDSIHLRQVLYIPVELASRSREYTFETTTTNDIFGSKTHSSSASDDMSTYSSTTSDRNSESTPSSPPTSVRKIPARQLSFFPPPSKTLDGATTGDGYLEPPQPRNHTIQSSPSGHRYSPTSGSHNSLASILTALPIAASTRDEIMTRLSFDSVSSSFSDRSRVNSDEDKGHELDDVARHKASAKLSDTGWDDFDEMSMPTPKASTRLPKPPPPPKPDSPHPSSVPKMSHTHSLSSASPPRFYVSQANETFVRTSQLEPSPGMQIPTRRNNKAAGKPMLGAIKREPSSSRAASGTKSTASREPDWGLALDTM
ncbi:hypothetical protein CVT24_001581 [Panaeolus cyanescens]|uniref:LysM domain-containing protein n=1 Tax=Panaeolus cyanescens TaxID=181874 RepID=A0A409YFF2_9AGAR|nr:hypothetical protein CVT24_001581 [Panaeolus cyanescens]